ncbi:glycine cleavage system protein GcvH [Geosporobacter ferrireducens]|uniref:Glycine cleavage system H protein n=1 Tax=Geosporobacter ferrireducens TaxID=1424294 RepID=A0A1D8GEA7_9FIRM|nr:glycine cleavage system protein GcvH [Geosporobacter ferrireducens]AOT69210.1 glycine cleavage system protein H [Geosporobacter ferrireducens]MTI56889.1 glycine cleavage system protein GcvH [Geosporobacter ferrireducens]
MYPENLKYYQKHTWVKVEGDKALIGITHYAQAKLGEILFVEMPEVGDELKVGKDFGVVESSKVASDLYAPISGEVLEINERLDEEPEFINEEPYEAWIVKVQIADESELDALLSAESYEATLA